MGRGNVRGLVREAINSDFMRLKGYQVVDHPEIMPFDGLNTIKRPDHRINGKIFDSYAPKLGFTDWSGLYLGPPPEKKFGVIGWSLSSILEYTRDELRQFQREYIYDGIRAKVSSGQTRNILLNLSDMPSDPSQLLTEHFANMFNRLWIPGNSLESVVCIYPKTGSPFRGEITGKSDMWRTHLPSDMEAFQWIGGSTSFSRLPNGVAKGDGPFGSDSSGPGPAGPGSAGLGSAALGTTGGAGAVAGTGASFFSLGNLLTWCGAVAAIAAIAALLGWLLTSKDSKSKTSTKSSKAAVRMYRKQMSQVSFSKSTTPETLATAHNDMKIAVLQLIPPSIRGNAAAKKELEKTLEAEYHTLVVEQQVGTFFDNFISPFTTCLLLFYLASRFVDTLVTIATKRASLQSRILGTHVGLITLSLIGQLPHFVFLGVPSGPLRLLLSVCVVSMVVWLLHEFTGRLAYAASGITYTCQVLWDNTETDRTGTTKLTKPRRAAVTVATITILHVASGCLKSISVGSLMFKTRSQVFTPLSVFVKMFAYAGDLAVVLWLISLVMVALLVILALEMVFPAGSGIARKTMTIRSSANTLMDTLWKEAETFIDSKPDAF